MIKGLFQRDKSKLAPISDCYKLLDKYESGLSKKIANYILYGKQPESLKSIEGIGRSQLRESGVDVHSGIMFNLPKSEINALKKIDSSFRDVYTSDLLADLDVCKRWATVRCLCIDMTAKVAHYQARVPVWLAALFFDMQSRIEAKYSQSSVPKHYTFEWFVGLFESNNLGEEVWFPVLFERMNSYFFVSEFFNTVIRRSDLVKTLQERDARNLYENLDISGRITIARELNLFSDLERVLSFIMLIATDPKKEVRVYARALVEKIDYIVIADFVSANYSSYSASNRKEIVQLIAFLANDKVSDLLHSLIQAETTKSVIDVIEKTIANKSAAKSTSEKELLIPNFDSLLANVELPERCLLKLKAQYKASLEKAYLASEEEIRENQASNHNREWRQNSYKQLAQLTEIDLEQGLDYLANGCGEINSEVVSLIIKAKLFNDVDFNVNHIIRLIKNEGRGYVRLTDNSFSQWLSSHHNEISDLRQLSEIIVENGLDHRIIANWILENRWETGFELPETYNINIWAFFAEYDEYLKKAFGLYSGAERRYRVYELGHALLLLKSFPVIPEVYLLQMYEHALSPAKTYGPLARSVLENYGLVDERLMSALESNKQDERVVAAKWIADIKLEKAKPALIKALKKEKREIVKANILSALHKIGEDISVYLSAENLLKEAEKGLKKSMPKGLGWFPFNQFPTLKWLDGKIVDAKILTWWVVLSVKLKQPEGNPLLNLYLKQLDLSSRENLGMYILQLFIVQDIRCPSDDEADAYARKKMQAQYNNWQVWSKLDWGAHYKDKTLDDAYNSLFKEKKSIYLGSAISEKGVLALTC